MAEFTRRVARAAETILENERLTADLDDAAAKVLLEWGVACAERIAQGTAGLDDAEAERVMSPRLRATRRLMRSVNRWIASRWEMDAESSAAVLTQIIDQAAIIYGEEFEPPVQEQRDAFVKQIPALVDRPAQLIADLRALVEHAEDDSACDAGGK
jgi:hypothetical protein